jgi:peptidoglycan/LPS O-acetylase OafA/YrhL
MVFAGKSVEPQNFVLLDGLRGLGAVLVLIGHTMMYWGPFWAPSGAVIVDLFFLLSGFVIAYSYEDKFAAGMGVREFMVHRVVRLYPLYLLGTLMGFAFWMLTTVGDPDGGQRAGVIVGQLIPGLVVLPSPEALSPNLYPLNNPAWTLLFEFLVNFVYVLAFRWLRNTRILLVVTLLCAAVLIATVLTIGRIDAGSDWATAWAGFGRAGFGFFAGVLAFRLLGSPRTTKRPSSNWAFVILIAIPIACFVPATDELRPWLDLFLAVILGIPLLVISQSVAPPKRFTNLFVMGGRLSYGIYILHQPFRELMKRLSWHDPAVIAMAPLGGILVLVAVVTLAYFAEKYYDRPVRRWIVNRLKLRAAGRAAIRAQKLRQTQPAASFAE